ncbi:PREDICTED: transmembrane protein 115, partial [Cariama cristata]|uniref:transmembrane protein 115 n=1 Tax=Cariama cristata TaxID=54380 RepID=UPI000520B94C
NVSVGLLGALAYFLTYVASFHLAYLFTVRIHGGLGFLGGVLVALKQTMGDSTVLKVPQIRMKAVPMLLLLFLALLRVANLVHGILVKVKVCRKTVKRYDVGAPSSITISLPGTDPQDAERR